MALVVANEGLPILLRRMLRPEVADADPFKLGLFKSNYTPAHDTTLASFTEADYAGYARIDLDPADWNDPTSGLPTSTIIFGIGAQVFLATASSQQVYGYFVLDATETLVLWAERFAGAPFTITTTIPAVVVPVMQLRSDV